MSDEDLAKQLQAQFDNEYEEFQKKQQNKTPDLQGLNLDLSFIQQLSQDPSSANQTQPIKPESNGTPAQGAATNQTDLSLLELQKKQQEELDMILAMKFQEEMYAQGLESEFKNKPPPLPASYNYAPPPAFTLQHRDSSEPAPTKEAITRIMSDLKEVFASKNPFIHVHPSEDDVTHVQSLIVGPPDTPYAYGFFHFDMLYPHNYPWAPPKVQIVTTDSGRCRFNPNLYSNGKVCLSILGTWSGPGWSSIQTMMSTLLSIQSLMNPKPYQNEPGYETERNSGDIEKYNQCITHETIRVAVCGMLENPTCGELFEDVMHEQFLQYYDHYIQICEKNIHLDGKNMDDPFGEKRGKFRYAQLLQRLKDIKIKLETVSNNTSNATSNNQITASNVDVQPMDTDLGAPTSPMETEKPEGNPSQNTPANTEPVKVATVATPSQFDLDLDFAKKLQEEWIDDYGNAPFGAKKQTKPSKGPSVSLAELKAQAEKEKTQPETEKDAIQCLICHQNPREYVVLPGCQLPHIYCFACANKMLKQGAPQNAYNPYVHNRRNKKQSGASQTIQCVLCSAISSISGEHGLQGLKRRQKRKLEEKRDKCYEHQEDYFMYCLDCHELLCMSCAGGTHARHNIEALDVAQSKVELNLQKQISSLEVKKANIQNFVDNVKKSQGQIATKSEAIQKEARRKFEELRKILEDKEKEIIEAIQRTEATKNGTIQSELTKADQRSTQIDEAMAALQGALCARTPLEFLQKIEDADEVRFSLAAQDPEVKQKWFTMQPLHTQHLEMYLKNLKYKDMKPGYFYGQEDDLEDDYPEEEQIVAEPEENLY